MRCTLLLLAAALSLTAADKKPKKDEWKPMFDGSTLEGWKANEHPESWTVKDGAIRGDGPASHLFYMGEQCVNCEFKAEVRINHGGNSGMYFRTAFGPGFPKGYEAQVDNTHRDPVRTGSLYNFVKVFEQLIPDDTWWTQHVIVEGNHIQIFVNDKKTVDFVDERNTYTSGYLALQQHNAGSVVEFKNLMMKMLPGPRSPLAGTWKLDREQSKFSVGEPPTQLEIRILEEGNGLRYQSQSVTADGQKHGANYFFRLDGYDYRMTGNPAADHVAVEALDQHYVHQGMRTARLRKKFDEHQYQVVTKNGREVIGKATYTVSADGATLTREGSTKHADGQELQYKEVLHKNDPVSLSKNFQMGPPK
ncbi:MAG TPA: DUF1080 domain-containing protein [Bryobacteraceae bacterium]|nr:DUF1080 domain-containing protein [Bryobacteraceae bacterium]